MNPLDKRPEGIPTEEWQAHLDWLNDPVAQSKAEKAAESEQVPVEALEREQRSIEVEDDLARALDAGKKINEKTMGRPVTSYRCPRGCLLAVALKADDGEVYMAWKPGPSFQSVPIGLAGTAAADRARELRERFGVNATRWSTSSRSEVLDIGKSGAEKPVEATRISRFPQDRAVFVSCRHMEAAIGMGQVPNDVNGPNRKVYLP